MNMKVTLFAMLFVVVLLTTVGSVTAQNYKIKQTVSMEGQKMTNTTYVKGSRKRTESSGMMGMGADVADIEQCDLKQNVKVNDKKKLYTVSPFDTGADPAPIRPTGPKTKTPVTKGGTVTYVSNITDTGERKTMFGMTARHIKTSMSVESSPDACSKSSLKMESDGWYIDLPEFSCPVNMRPSMPQYDAKDNGGCKDKINFRNTGGGKVGFALTETRNMMMEDTATTQTTETLEFTKATLEQSLFDVPVGYAVASNPQDLYGKPDMAAMMKAAQAGNDDDDEDKPKTKSSKGMGSMGSNMPSSGGTPAAKKAGTIRIGVLAPTNKGENISITNMQSFLAQKLTSGNVEGVAVGNEADAKSAGCDYILSSDFSKLKQSAAGKIGGMFGKITSTSVGGVYEAQVDFKLVSTASGQTVLQNKAAAKAESDIDRAAEGVLAQEATAVLGKAQN